ncbi:MAG: cytochrome ubiquinol oxidase subunit I [Treponemataceae bacterium]
MTAVMIARVQFGLSLGFHYIFPQTTLGLTLVILIAEWRYVASGDQSWKDISTLCSRFLGVVFAFGVATGMALPFSFGMNWGNFSLFAAPIFGVQLAIEAMVAFTLEAAFMAVLMFGRSRVSKRVYLASAFFVFLGSHLSAFFIISANSWLQTPAGYAVKDGRLVLTDYLAATFNPSVGIRFFHTITAAWLSGLFFLLAISACMIARNRGRENAKKLFRFSAALSLALGLIQPVLGHQQIMDVLRHQPVKDAAYEGIFETQNGAPLIGFGIPDAANGRILFPMSIPKGLSFLESGNPNSLVKGLNDFPKETWPPVNIIFTTFHLMVPMAGIIIAVALSALWFTGKKSKKPLEARPLYLKLVMFGAASPYLANELGWIGTEIGRQPWTVYGLLLTKDAGTSAQGAGTVAFSLILFSLVYLVLGFLFVMFTSSVIKSVPKAD